MVRAAALRPILILGGEPVGEVDHFASDLRELERFIVNNPDLEPLEALLDRFNIFEAVGLVRQEIRHSTFLAFLLDPNESHGMGDAFVKRLLQRAVMDSPSVSAPVTPIELSLWDFGQMDVRRERQHIDIFLLDERNRLAVIIENKIGAGEHGDQLDRYYEAVREQYPDYRLLALYLMPGGDEPSHPEYLPVDYRAVCEILDGLAESRASVTEPDLRVLITHYTEMLRRHIVGDSEIARLSQQIYQKHKRAIDLIYEHRFAQQEHVRSVLEKRIRETAELSFDKARGDKIHFGVHEWDTPTLLTGDGWSRSKRILTFEFQNFSQNLNLALFITRGDEEVRQKLFDMVNADSKAGCGVIEPGASLVHESLFGRLAHQDPPSRGQGDAKERGRQNLRVEPFLGQTIRGGPPRG